MQPFHVSVSDEVLKDLVVRLRMTRWPDQVPGTQWRWGTELGFLQRLCNHWAERFDWRAAEARLNALPQFHNPIEGFGLYFVHAKSEASDAVPLLLLNGWPSSIFEHVDVIPMLTAAGFHVVAPSFPGFGFSDRPSVSGVNGSKIANLFVSLMAELGYERFIGHGSDLGAHVLDRIRVQHPDHLIGAHFSNVFSSDPSTPEDASEEEIAYLNRVRSWSRMEGAYAMIQGTKPQTLGYGLTDSPTGMASWIAEKFEAWGDGEVQESIGLDGLCANLTLYWVTETIVSSTRLYAEMFSDHTAQASPERGKVPVGVIIFPRDIIPAPRIWAERLFNLVQWTEAPAGGHFGAWEQPAVLTKTLRSFADILVS